VGAKGPRVKGYRGPGQWHKVEGKFYAPRFNAAGNKIANARFEQITVDGVMVVGATECEGVTGGAISDQEVSMGPLRFQATAGLVAMGDIRVKRLVEGEQASDGYAWQALDLELAEATDFELRGRFTLSDGGAAALEFHVPADGGSGMSLLLDHTSPGSSRTGSIGGFNPITTQFLQPGIPFDLLLRSQGNQIDVFLNGVLVNTIQRQRTSSGTFLIHPEVIPGTQLKVEDLEFHTF
jgi:hypothetical protein